MRWLLACALVLTVACADSLPTAPTVQGRQMGRRLLIVTWLGQVIEGYRVGVWNISGTGEVRTDAAGSLWLDGYCESPVLVRGLFDNIVPGSLSLSVSPCGKALTVAVVPYGVVKIS